MKKNTKMKWGLLLSITMIPSAAHAATMGVTTADSLNIRKAPAATGEVIKKVANGTTLKLADDKSTLAGWYKVMLESNETAYVKDDFIKITTVTGTVTENNLNFRSYPSLTQSQIMAKLPKGTEVTILYKVDDFYKVLVNGVFGFVYADYVKVPYSEHVGHQDISSVRDVAAQQNQLAINNSVSALSSNENTYSHLTSEENKPKEDSVVAAVESYSMLTPISEQTGVNIAAFGMQFVGNPYVYGGNDLLTGVDCSGYTQQVMKAFNINIPRTSKDQSKTGILVNSLDEAKPGDLIFFGESIDEINHVGLYIGDHYMVHSSTPETGIIISNITERGFSSIQLIRRMVQP